MLFVRTVISLCTVRVNITLAGSDLIGYGAPMSKKVQANISDELYDLAFLNKGKMTDRLKELITLGISAETLAGTPGAPMVELGMSEDMESARS